MHTCPCHACVAPVLRAPGAQPSTTAELRALQFYLLQLTLLENEHHKLKRDDILTIYAYSYELKSIPQREDEEPVSLPHQIYKDMNIAMRTKDREDLLFWRPFIRLLDTALAKLGSHEERVYRGIGCKFSATEYAEGSYVMWPAFSSSSTDPQVLRAEK